MISAKCVLEDFMKLPKRAQELFFEILDDSLEAGCNPYYPFDLYSFCAEECESPIEILFDMAFKYEACKKPEQYFLIPQCEILVEGKKYRADFLFDTKYNQTPCFGFENEYSLIIECDGHEFHEKTKEQVIQRNERDIALKKAGYDILHFSGSQIYRNPLRCAKQTVNYIASHTKAKGAHRYSNPGVKK